MEAPCTTVLNSRRPSLLLIKVTLISPPVWFCGQLYISKQRSRKGSTVRAAIGYKYTLGWAIQDDIMPHFCTTRQRDPSYTSVGLMRQSATLSLSISLARKPTTKQRLFSNTMNCLHRRRKSTSELLHLKDHRSGPGIFEVNSIRISRKDVEEPCSAPSYSIDASNCLQP